MLRPQAGRSELRVFYEPESARNILAREFGDEPELLARADFVRQELVKNGWIELGPSGVRRPAKSAGRKRATVGVSLVAAMAAMWAWRRRRAKPKVSAD
jgi:hypothetical protein